MPTFAFVDVPKSLGKGMFTPTFDFNCHWEFVVPHRSGPVMYTAVGVIFADGKHYTAGLRSAENYEYVENLRPHCG